LQQPPRGRREDHYLAMVAVDPGQNRFQGVDRSSVGFKLLSRFGWKEGDGLVRQNSRLGITYFVLAVTSLSLGS
jgi:G-patch domain